MPTKDSDGTIRCSLKLPPDLFDEIDDFAENRVWSRSKAVAYLMSEGISGPDHGVSIVKDGSLRNTPISISTNDEDTVRNIEGLADDEYGGSFNAAARWAIRNGLQEATRL